MNNHSFKASAFLKQLQAIFLIALILYFGKVLFIPMMYGLLIAIVWYPACKWLERRHWPRSLAVTAGLLLVGTFLSALVFILFVQMNMFRKDLPELIAKTKPTLLAMQTRMENGLGFSIISQNELLSSLIQNIKTNAGSLLTNAASATAGTFYTLFLTPVYSALFLYNRNSFVLFVSEIAGAKYRHQLKIIFDKVIHTYHNFIKGMIIVYLIVGALNSIGLFALGIPHAILFGMLTAIMTIIPYVGIAISAILPIAVAWMTKDSIWYPIGVIGVFAVVQYLEANVIFPKVVATQLNVSTWATLVAIIAGGIIWGVSGMILFIPIIGIIKILLEYIPEWAALNTLLRRE